MEETGQNFKTAVYCMKDLSECTSYSTKILTASSSQCFLLFAFGKLTVLPSIWAVLFCFHFQFDKSIVLTEEQALC